MLTRIGRLLATSVLAVAALGAAARGVPLIEAAKHDDLAALQALLAKHADPNAAEADGSTALHWAAQHGNRDAVERLIRAGARVTASNRYGVTALGLASVRGSAAVVEALLKAGADPNSREAGDTPLLMAARTGDADTVRALLAHGADVHAKDDAGMQTALMWAAAENNDAAIRVLLEAGADVKAMSGHEGARGPMGTPLGQFDRIFGKAGPQTSPSNVASMAALHFAARAGHIPAVRALLRAGADVNQTTEPQRLTPLVLAIMNAHFELAALLLDAGADPNYSEHGWTPLHELARVRAPIDGLAPWPEATGHLPSLELGAKLLAAGANVNARMTASDLGIGYRYRLEFTGATPFLLAAKSSDLELMRLLLARGANPLLATEGNATPLMVAAGVGAQNPGEEFRTDPAGEPYALEAVKMCLALGGEVNAIDSNGETALHGAAYLGRNSVVQLLADNGARFDITNLVGWTPLRIADGVYYSGHQKQQRHTAVLLRQLMRDRGMRVEDAAIENVAVPNANLEDSRVR